MFVLQYNIRARNIKYVKGNSSKFMDMQVSIYGCVIFIFVIFVISSITFWLLLTFFRREHYSKMSENRGD